MEFIFSDKKVKEVKSKIKKRKIVDFFYLIFEFFIFKPFNIIYLSISNFFYKSYCKIYPHRLAFKKRVKQLIFAYCLFVLIFNLIRYFQEKPINYQLIIHIPIIMISYLVVKFLLFLYHFFIGDYQLLEEDYFWTKNYVTTKLPHLLKPNGETGAGKDTIVSGMESVIVEHFKMKTAAEMETIKEICYIFDFELLDQDLADNYNMFLSFSQKKIKEAFLGTIENPGMSRFRNGYLKSYYFKKKIIKVEFLLNDYENFILDPINYPSKYTSGVGVNRKHFIQIIMEDYIGLWIRVNIEKNYILSNQPKIENLETGLMAKMFNFNFLRSRSQSKPILDRKINKRINTNEHVFFPWKDRLIIDETEADTWWGNKDTEIASEIIKGGIRDTKAYNRHYIKDLYWFQIGQAAERTNKLMRELEHGYIYVYSRTNVPGGKKRNLFLNFILKFYNKKIYKIEKKRNKQELRKIKNSQHLEDLKNLFIASSDIKYKRRIDRLNSKLKVKEYKDKYYKMIEKISKIKEEILTNEKSGYIVLDACVSKSPDHPLEYNALSFKQLMKDSTRVPTTFVGRFVFKISDCERYDTRYMKALAEERSQQTEIEYAEVPRWPKTMKMTKKEALATGYLAAKDMFGITDEEYDNLRFGDGYDEFKIEP